MRQNAVTYKEVEKVHPECGNMRPGQRGGVYGVMVWYGHIGILSDNRVLWKSKSDGVVWSVVCEADEQGACDARWWRGGV